MTGSHLPDVWVARQGYNGIWAAGVAVPVLPIFLPKAPTNSTRGLGNGVSENELLRILLTLTGGIRVYTEIFRNFLVNMRTLKNFVSGVETALGLSTNDLFDKKFLGEDREKLLPLAVILHKISPESSPINSDLLDKMENILRQVFQIEVKEKDSDGAVSIQIRSKKGLYVKEMVEQISLQMAQIDMLFHSSLISMVVFLELLVSRALHCHISKYPESITIKDKSLTLEEIRKLGTIEEAQKYLIDREVESIMHASLSSWLSYLRDKLKLSLKGVDEVYDDLVEIFQRRNLLVHNGGVVNSIYMRNVNPRLTANMTTGTKVKVNREYVDSAMSIVESAGIHIILEMWRRVEKCSQERIDTVMAEAYSYLLTENWNLAGIMYNHLLFEKQISAEDKLICQVNYWQCVKWQGDYERIQADVEAVDFSAYSGRFRIALAALKGDKDAFFKLLAKLCPREISFDEVMEWPLFREMRSLEEFEEFRQRITPVQQT